MNKPKTTGLDLLNKVQRFVIDYSNTHGIQLASLGTVQQFKQFIVALTIQTLTDNGHTMEQAFDIVFGDGSFHKLAEDVWETIRRNEAAKATA